jgi:hypothetical protein
VPASLHVLLRVFQVLLRPGRARTPRTRHRPRLASLRLRRVTGSLQALSNAPFGQCPLPGRLRTPCTAIACRGPSARKTLRDREGSLDYPYPAWYWLPDKARSGLPVLLRGRVRVFAAIAPLHAKQCEGCGGGAVKNALRCVFQGLRRSRDSASKGEQCQGDEGASPSETPKHRKTRIARVPQGTGVDPRVIRFFI